MLERVFERFGELLDVRLERGVFTTEDSVRYTFYTALLEIEHLGPEDIVLEHPHPVIAGAEIDTLIPGFPPGGLAIEFKYDRAMPSGRNAPRPQKAGKAIQDLHRLGRLPAEMRRVFVYATDPEMAAYFASPKNGLVGMFNLTFGHQLAIDDGFLATRCATLRHSAGATPNVTISAEFLRSLPRGHELRIYRVEGLEHRASHS